MKHMFTLAAGAALTFALGCGGNSVVPTAPAPVTSDVAAIVALKIDGVPGTMTVGERHQLKVTATLAGGSTLDVTGRAVFKTSNAAVAAISATGLVSLLAPGECGLTALVDNISASVDARVKAKEVITRLEIHGKADLLLGEQSQLKVIAILDTGAHVDVTASAELRSGDEAILKVRGSGMIEAVGTGTCDVIAIAENVRATLQLKVNRKEASIIRIRIDGKLALKVGEHSQLKAFAVLSDNTEMDVTHKVKWSTSNGGCCLVNLVGLLTALIPGECMITGTLDDAIVSVPVKVTLL